VSGESFAVRFFLLGQFEISHGGRILRAGDWNRHKAAALLKRLAWERKLLKEAVVDHLWPNASLSSGLNNLYRTIHEIRRTLNTHLGQGSADQVFSFTDGILTLSNAWVDAHEYEKAAKAFNTDYLIANYAGDFLPDDLYESWTQMPREMFLRLYKEALLSRVEAEPASVLESLTPILARNPLDESVHRAVMLAYALTGRRHEALRQYQACKESLDSELGISPDPQTTQLYEKIHQGELIANSRGTMPAPSAGLPFAPLPIETATRRPFIGRRQELETLLLHMHATAKGSGGVILLSGDTGVGKTRLAYEALQVAVSSGMRALLGGCYEQEGQHPYQPFVEAFNHYLSTHQLPYAQNPILNLNKSDAVDPQQEKWHLFNAVTEFLQQLARQAALVLLVDDLHAADEASLSLFHFLARQTRTTPLVLIATYREDTPSTKNKPFGALLNALYREQLGMKLIIQRLALDDVEGVVESILGGKPDSQLLQAVFEVTEGNPFFVEEVAQSLLKEGMIRQENGVWILSSNASLPIPSPLTELLLERVRNLGEKAGIILTAGAVLGREFRFDLLQGLINFSTTETLDALDAALAGHLIEETDTGYRFRHVLIRQTLYDSLSRARRTHLHMCAAEAIETMFSDHASGLGAHVENLAYHYLRSPERGKALAYLLKAGEQAASYYALEVAIKHYEEALSLMNEFHLEDPARRWGIHESLGWWYDALADIPHAVHHFEEALAISATDFWKSAPRDRARLHRAAATVLITGGNLVQGEKHLKAALSEVDEKEDASDYSLLLYTLSQYHWHKNEYRQAFDVAQRSMQIAERLNDQIALTNAFEMLALTCHSLGEWQAGLKFEQQRALLAGDALDVTSAFDVHL
jgi:DNA-binding SARP family transcriptional activator/tetratricopeptide (TPR) repeat protein